MRKFILLIVVVFCSFLLLTFDVNAQTDLEPIVITRNKDNFVIINNDLYTSPNGYINGMLFVRDYISLPVSQITSISLVSQGEININIDVDGYNDDNEPYTDTYWWSLWYHEYYGSNMVTWDVGLTIHYTDDTSEPVGLIHDNIDSVSNYKVYNPHPYKYVRGISYDHKIYYHNFRYDYSIDNINNVYLSGNGILTYTMEQSSYEQGYIDGYNDGYNDGYEVGRDVGIGIGYDDGYDVGYEEGRNAGIDIGYDIGYNEGYEKALENADIDKFIANFDKWIVPAIIVVMLLGGYFAVRRQKMEEL